MATLDLDFSDDRILLRDTVQRLAATTDSPSWDDLTDQVGLGALTLPHEAGGFGGTVADVAVVMAELGPVLAGADWLSHAAACHLLGMLAKDHPALPALAAGSSRAALVGPFGAATLPEAVAENRIEGSARLVAGGERADLFVVLLDGKAYLVGHDAPGLSRDPVGLRDGTRAADLHFASVRAAFLGEVDASAASFAQAGLCAEAIGIMQRMLDDTVGFLNQRRQFGAPLASFQSLRHRLADMRLALLQAQALTELAVKGSDINQGWETDLAAATVAVRDAARIVGEGAIQLHGAMGLTDELALGARFKRLMSIASRFGSENEALERFAASCTD